MLTMSNGTRYPGDAWCSMYNIAASLSKLCRWNGHVRRFYSVAEHCVLGARICKDDPDLAQTFLLHDAAEIIIGDIPTPIKEMIPDIKEFEAELLIQIGDRYGVDFEKFETSIKILDRQMAAFEYLYLMPPPNIFEVPALDIEIKCWPPLVAERNFMRAAVELGLIQ